ncbi:MAG: Mor transcription activator family protein [Clostridiales bacterium]|nr:Mor transcription activator family protein [Clostridiales bacterium]
MDKHKENNKDNWICMEQNNMLKSYHEVFEMSQYNINLFHKVYREISEELGIEAALTIHQMFKGMQVSFPIRFLDSQCVKEMIVKEYDGTNIKMLAKKYDYSEKTIRRIIKESIKK